MSILGLPIPTDPGSGGRQSLVEPRPVEGRIAPGSLSRLARDSLHARPNVPIYAVLASAYRQLPPGAMAQINDRLANGVANIARVATLPTAAWYGDRSFDLELPDQWDVEVFWPRTPPELTDEQIGEALANPIGQPPIRQLARGCVSPVVVVDDPTRPTPASRVMPFLLREFEAAGIAASAVTVVVATGTHGPPDPRAVIAKVGQDAAIRCRRIHIHDHRRDVVRLGQTRFGTPIFVDRVVAAADFVVGIGGVYPQHTAWFGGGSKILLGVLGERSIAHLHYTNWNVQQRYATDNRFRADLNQVAEIVGMRTCISIHVDAARRPVRVVSGDALAYYGAAVQFSRDAFRAPAPGDADVVISNAYPMDTSVTFAESKGTIPLKHTRPAASKVLIAACSEGGGNHGLFPLLRVPSHHYEIQRLRRAWINRSQLPGKIAARLRASSYRQSASAGEPNPYRPIRLYRPIEVEVPVQGPIPGIREMSRWEDVLDEVAHEQPADRRLRAVVYPCAPLQVLEL